jgi:CheY-like chemotaxis protein
MAGGQTVPEKSDFRILLVEDDPQLQEIFRTIIRGLGLHVSVDTSYDVELAEILLSNRPDDLRYDIVISDINLPGRSGLDLVSLCKAKIPLIVMSSIPEAEYLERFRGTGIKPPPFLQKPFSPNKMLQLITELGGFKAADKAPIKAAA